MHRVRNCTISRDTLSYVFPNHVVTDFLQSFQVINHRFKTRRGVKTIRPIPKLMVKMVEICLAELTYPWSSVPNMKMNSPFSSGLNTPLTSPLDIVLNPM